MSFVKKGSLVYFFWICMSFISFSSLTALARISSKMMNKSVKRNILGLFPIWERKHPFCITRHNNSYRFFVGVLYEVEEVTLYVQFAESFIMNRCFFCIESYDYMMFFFNLLIRWVTLQLALKQHVFKLHGAPYMRIFFNKYIEKIFWRFVTVWKKNLQRTQ